MLHDYREFNNFVGHMLTSMEEEINESNKVEQMDKEGYENIKAIRSELESVYKELKIAVAFRDPSASRAREVYLDLVKEATKEILFIFPSTNAFSRQHKIGAVGLAEKAATERNVEVRILMPANNSTDNTVQNLGYAHKIDIRYIKQMPGTMLCTTFKLIAAPLRCMNSKLGCSTLTMNTVLMVPIIAISLFSATSLL
jgi:hypothetical protein